MNRTRCFKGEVCVSSRARTEASPAKGPVAGNKQGRNQPAAIGARRAGCAAVGTAQVRAGDAARHDLIGLATPGALRSDVVENPVVAKARLVHRGRGKHVSLPDGYLPRVVDNSLIAAERASLGKSAGKAARNEGDGVVVAKTGEESIAGRQVVVQTNVEFGCVELAHGLANEVESRGRVIGVWYGGEVRHGLPDVVNQTGRDFVTRSSGWLASVRVCRQRVPCRIAVEIDVWKHSGVCRGPDHVRIDDCMNGDWAR